MGHARALLGTPDRAFQEQLAKRVVAEDLSVREVEEAIRHARGVAAADEAADRARPAKLRPPGLLELEELLGDYLETRVKHLDEPAPRSGRDRVRNPRGPRAHLPGHHRGPGRREPSAGRASSGRDVDRLFDAPAHTARRSASASSGSRATSSIAAPARLVAARTSSHTTAAIRVSRRSR